MKAIIFAAGKGTRMEPLTLKTHKSMLLVCGKPILENIFDTLPDQITEIVLVVGHMKDQIIDYFGDSYKGKPITYVEQKEARGTAHCMLLVKDLLKEGEKFLVMYADDLHSKEAMTECLKHDLCLLVKEVDNPKEFGIVSLRKDGKIADLIEKPDNPPTNLASVGVYVLDTRIFDYKPVPHPKNGEYYLTDMIEGLIKDYPVDVVHTDYWQPIGYPKDLEQAQESFAIFRGNENSSS